MARPNDDKLSSIVLYKQYCTYQGVYDIYASSKELSAEDVFHKAILIIMNWQKKRIGSVDFKISEKLQRILDKYPATDGYQEFRLGDEYGDGLEYYQESCNDELDMFIAYIPQSGEWSMRFTEIDNGSEGKKETLPTRIFINDCALKMYGDRVTFAFRTICKQPYEYTENAEVLRPAFLSLLYGDTDFVVVESGISKEYPINKPVIINPKSKSDCDEFSKKIICNTVRQKPVILYNKKAGQKIEDMEKDIFGYATVVVEEESKEKGFANLLKMLNVRQEDWDHVKDGWFMLITGPGERIDKENYKLKYEPECHENYESLAESVWNYTIRDLDKNDFDYHRCFFARNLKDEYEKRLRARADEYEEQLAKCEKKHIDELNKTIDELNKKLGESITPEEKENFKNEIISEYSKGLEGTKKITKDEKEYLRKRIEKLENDLHKKDKLSGAYEDARRELVSLREFAHGITDETAEKVDISDANMKKAIAEKKILIIGGHTDWHNKLKKIFPEWRCIDPDSVLSADKRILDGADYVFFFTKHIGHDGYKRFITLIRKKNIPMGYISSRDIDMVTKQVYGACANKDR